MNSLALFDIDNTLIRSSNAHRSVFITGIKKVYGFDTDYTGFRPDGMTDPQIIFEILKRRDISVLVLMPPLSNISVSGPELSS